MPVGNNTVLLAQGFGTSIRLTARERKVQGAAAVADDGHQPYILHL